MSERSNLFSSRIQPQTCSAPDSAPPAASSATAEPDSVSSYIEGFLLDRRARRHSPRTIATYADRLPRLVWFLEHQGIPTTLAAVTSNHLRAFLVYLSEQTTARWDSTNAGANRPLSPSSIHAYARVLRTFFRWVTLEAGLPKNPWETVQMPRQPSQWQVQAYTTDEIALLFSTCEQAGHPFLVARNRAILAVLLDSGLRASELLALRVSDVDLSDGTFTVVGKGDKSRIVVIGQYARRELWGYLKQRSRLATPEQALFVAQGGNPLTYNALRLMFAQLRQLTGITRVHVRAHVCRHTAATNMYRNGIRGATLQELLGHASFDTTRRWYLNVSREDLVQEHAAAGPLDHMAHALNETRGRPLLPRSIPDAPQLQREVAASTYRAVARRYGVSDTAIRKRLQKAGLL